MVVLENYIPLKYNKFYIFSITVKAKIPGNKQILQKKV